MRWLGHRVQGVSPALLLGLVWLIFGLRDGGSGFLTEGNVYAVLTGSSVDCLVAVGLGFTVLLGEGDLSVGSMAVLGGVLCVRLASLGLVPSLALTTAILTLVGAAQGYAIYKLRINSLVFTVGSLIGLSGVAYVVSDNGSISLPVASLSESDAITNRILGIFCPFSLVALGFALLAWIGLTYSRAGRELYALGGGRREALAAGVAARPRFVLAFACSAGASALGGALVAIEAGGAAPTGGLDLLLTAITGVLVGGVALTGGAGSVIGIVIGTLAIGSIASGVAIEGAGSNVSDLLTAALLVGVIILDVGATRLPWRRVRPNRPGQVSLEESRES
jgi:ribose/xylose/arabinose/galactoside ABC-type transport system permease subunit